MRTPHRPEIGLIAVVVPALNEAATIGKIVHSLKNSAAVVVVDDGSTDDTAKLAGNAGAVVVHHDRNMGYDAALETGLRHAYAMGADLLITFDADGQHDPKTLDSIVNAVRDRGAEIVVGHRPEFARFAERVFAVYTTLRYGIRDPLCGLKAFRREIYSAYSNNIGCGTVNTGLLLQAARNGAQIENLPIIIHQRQDTARVGSIWKANIWILGAWLRAVASDLFHRRSK